jgi:ubiquinone/menaquinone biosynthesis C-methylase UbiE
MSRARELSDYPPEAMEVRIIERFVSLRGERILEIGCGDGRLTRQIAPLARSVHAIDPDPARVVAARRSAAQDGLTNVTFRVGTAERLRFGGGAFDIALFSWSL